MKSSIPPDPRIVLAGSVSTSRRTLQSLLRHNMQVVGVLGLSISASRSVSGYSRLDDLANAAQIPYLDFQSINHNDVLEAVRSWKPDLLFVVGLSQLVQAELMSIPALGCVGFHPTALPRGRGRAPLAWLVLDGSPGVANFFLMQAEADAGPLLAKEPFPVQDTDYAADVLDRMECAIDRALDRWLPRLKMGEWSPSPQDENLATYNGKREPSDGMIDWALTTKEIFALIRSASHPHPGAFTHVDGRKLIVWRAELDRDGRHRGVTGRVLLADPQKGWLVQAGDGSIWLTDIVFEDTNDAPGTRELRVGQKLGVDCYKEIADLKQRIQALEKNISELNSDTKGTR